MKNKFIFIFFTAILFLSFFALTQVFAAESEYNIVAENLLKYLSSDKEIISYKTIEANALDSTSEKVVIAYLADLEGGGYILVSASKCLNPVKAYSLNHDFATLPDPYKQFLLSEMEYNIRTITISERTTKSVTDSETQERWDFLLNFGKVRTTLEYQADTYLLTTQWNQNYPYNKFLPEIDDDNVVAGCVNIALAQVMKYHNYPSTGTGVARYAWNDEELKTILYRTYNWENMPDVLDEMQPEYKIDEVALLIKDLGIVNQTAFGLDGSAASINTSALVENFGYSNSITSMDNNNNTDTALFFNTLKAEINAERPVLLSFPGHMTVADGYSSNETGREIHVNMGWGGHYDDYYFLEDNVVLGDDFDFSPDLTIYYNIKPCSGDDCLELDDNIDESDIIRGKFDYAKDKDEYEVYLKGNTTISGYRDYYGNQGLHITIFNSNHTMIVSNDDNIAQNFLEDGGLYTIEVSLCNGTSCYTYDEYIDYSVNISTEDLTADEKATIDNALEIQPVINNDFRDILLNSSDPETYKILIDARDENGDLLGLSVKNTNTDAVEAVLSGNILELTPVLGALNIAGKITVTAAANNKTAQKSFVVMVSDEDISFGKEFIVRGIFENQVDFNTHKVILDGPCTITGYRSGYANQAFYSSVIDEYGNELEPPVAPVDGVIEQQFTKGIYLLGAALKEDPDGSGHYYDYYDESNHQYRLTISCPEADDSLENIAYILGIDLAGISGMGDVDGNGQLDLADAVTAMQILCGAIPAIPGSYMNVDVNNDGLIGLAEAVYILQYLAGLRLQ